jgi:integral membrane protein (TIGR01906 family)
MVRIRGILATLVIGVATALVIVALATLPFLNPVWVGFEQGRADAAAWTGYSETDLRTATDAILSDLVFGPPTFDVTVDGAPVLNERERAHMRDVRNVFVAFYLTAAIGAIVLVGAFALERTPDRRRRLWRRLGLIGRVIAVGTVALGLAGVMFFDTAFELFHELFFPPGSYLFNPATDRLVQLFPEQFWVETTIGVGIVIIVLSVGLAWWSGRRATSIAAAAEPDAGTIGASASAR